MNKIRTALFFGVWFGAFLTVSAAISLPSFFSSNMVLQRDSEVRIWGNAELDTRVTVVTSWNKTKYKIKSDSQGAWSVKVATPGAGGPYRITISDGESITLENILIGEVWICSGQSNMEFPMHGSPNQPIKGAQEAISKSSNSTIRLFTIPRTSSFTPQSNVKGDWELCEPQSVTNFSATAYFFGSMLNEVLDVPVGLIVSTWGATPIETWMSEDALRGFDTKLLPQPNQEEYKPQKNAFVAYNAMINPLVGMGIRGVIWYQGEANRGRHYEYAALMQAMITDWRAKWGLGDFPFYFAQIAPYKYWNDPSSAYLREAQLKASRMISNSSMACLLDAGEEKCIHPSNKEVVGQRLAYLALDKTYEVSGIQSMGPELEEMDVEGSKVKLTFRNAPYGLTSFGKGFNQFLIAGEDKVFYPAEVTYSKFRFELSSPHVENPVAIRYAFDDYVEGDLFNTFGLPASSFRTDNWSEDEIKIER